MDKIKVLNLYACLGGNRYKWDEVADIEVTAVELDPELARLYQERFPNDKVIVADAHKYLLDHYKEFDFIWSSPPCPTHSRLRKTNTGTGSRQSRASYPDYKLWQEIIFIKNFHKGKFCIENVISYYEPFIEHQKRGRHYYWCNFKLPAIISERHVKVGSGENEFQKLCDFHDYDFKKYKGAQRKDKISRNLVDYEAGKTIFQEAVRLIQNKPVEQIGLFAQQINN